VNIASIQGQEINRKVPYLLVYCKTFLPKTL